MLIAVDAGRSFVKVVSANKKFRFPSKISKGRERNFKETLDDDLEITYQGKDYFVGTLAEREGFFTRQKMTESKANLETLLLVLTAIFEARMYGQIQLVTGVPISMYTSQEREKLKQLLEGEHEIIVNGSYRKIHIAKVAITIEGGAAYWMNRREGVVRIVDPGARTTNYATFTNGVFIDRESGTIPQGWENVREADEDEMAALIVSHLGGIWSTSDVVELVGGKADDLVESFKKEGFHFTYVLKDAGYANALGYYAMGQELIR